MQWYCKMTQALQLIIPLFPKRKQDSKRGKRQNCFLLYLFHVTFTQAFCLKYAVSLLTQEREPNGSLVCDLSLKRQKAHTMSSSQTVQIRPVPCICQPSHYQQWYQQNEEVDQLVLFLAFPEARWMHKIRCRTVFISNHNCIQWVEVRPNPIKEKFNGTKCQGAIEFLRLCLNFGVKSTFAQAEHRNMANGRNYQKKLN